MVIVARREELLNSIAEKFRDNLDVEVRVVVADFSRPGASQAVFDAVADLDIGLVVPNAGIEVSGEFIATDLTEMSATVAPEDLGRPRSKASATAAAELLLAPAPSTEISATVTTEDLGTPRSKASATPAAEDRLAPAPRTVISATVAPEDLGKPRSKASSTVAAEDLFAPAPNMVMSATLAAEDLGTPRSNASATAAAEDLLAPAPSTEMSVLSRGIFALSCP